LRGLERFRELRGGEAAGVENKLRERSVAGIDGTAHREILAWRSLRDEKFRDLRVFGSSLLRRADREHERGKTVEGVLDGHVRSSVEQYLHDIDMTVIAGIEQCRRTVAELRVHVDAFVEQLLHRCGISRPCRVPELLGLGLRWRLAERDRGHEGEKQLHMRSSLFPPI